MRWRGRPSGTARTRGATAPGRNGDHAPPRARCRVAPRPPLGVAVEDYEFLEGPRKLEEGDAPATTVRLSELFTAPDRALVVQYVMYGKRQTSPCPMCTVWVDGLNGVVRHIARNADFVEKE